MENSITNEFPDFKYFEIVCNTCNGNAFIAAAFQHNGNICVACKTPNCQSETFSLKGRDGLNNE